MSKKNDVEYYLESDRIWPPTVWADRNHPFMVALREILERLPDEIIYELDTIQYIVESLDMIGVSVPFEQRVPILTGGPDEVRFRLDTIVIFEKAFQYSPKALIGLLAHEVAHCFVDGSGGHKEEETSADETAISWGFSDEIQQLKSEMREKNSNPS